MTPDHLPLQYVDILPPEQQSDGAWVYEANPHGPGKVVLVNGPVDHFDSGHHFGFSVPATVVGVPSHDFVNDSFGP